MARNRTQKGAGLLNWFRGKPKQVQPATPAAPIGTRRNTTKHETFQNALKRNFVFLHAKRKGEQPQKSKRFVTPQEEAEIRQILLDADARGLTADQIVEQIFHGDPKTFDDEFSAWEQYLPEKYLNKGTEYERLAFPVAASLERFIATLKMKSSPKNIAYASNFQTHICNPDSDLNQPVSSLRDTFCVTVMTPQNKEQFEVGKGYTYATSYLVIKPQFFPKGAAGPIVLNAQRLPVISFLLDAFETNGILEIEPTLKATLQREAPELLQFKEQEPVVLLTPYYLTDPSVTQQRFLVVDPSSFSRGRNVVNWKQFAASTNVQSAFAKRSVLLMDPKTMVQVRNFYPQLWLANFGAANQAFFTKLTPYEQVAFCFLQYTKFFEVYSLARDANPGNTKSIVEKKTLGAAKQARAAVFEVDYEKGANPFELAESFRSTDTENFRQLIDLQINILGAAKIQTPQDVNRLLAKFKPRSTSQVSLPDSSAAPPSASTRKNRRARVQQMAMPGNVQKERAVLVNALKTALKTPVKSSVLPNFLRSRTAKNANRQRFVQQIEKAKQNLLTFNREHGIPVPNMTYGYKF